MQSFRKEKLYLHKQNKFMVKKVSTKKKKKICNVEIVRKIMLHLLSIIMFMEVEIKLFKSVKKFMCVKIKDKQCY